MSTRLCITDLDLWTLLAGGGACLRLVLELMRMIVQTKFWSLMLEEQRLTSCEM
jgi:hypothetical protein